MRPHYLKAIKNLVLRDEIDKRMVEHLSVAYLNGWELLQEKNDGGAPSLFWKMLDEAKQEKRGRWLTVAEVCWSSAAQRIRKEDKEEGKDVDEGFRKKILAFWRWTYEQREFVQERLGDDYSPFLGRMSELTSLLDNIDDDSEKWLMLAAPHMGEHHNEMFFIRGLVRLEDPESIRRIGKIYLKVLEKTTPAYRQEEIQEIIRRIYRSGDPKDADMICDTYGRRGAHFLKEVYDEFHSRK